MYNPFLSWLVNFFIYCAMSEQFRRTFCGLFTCLSTATEPDDNDDQEDVQASPLDRVEMMSVIK